MKSVRVGGSLVPCRYHAHQYAREISHAQQFVDKYCMSTNVLLYYTAQTAKRHTGVDQNCTRGLYMHRRCGVRCNCERRLVGSVRTAPMHLGR